MTSADTCRYCHNTNRYMQIHAHTYTVTVAPPCSLPVWPGGDSELCRISGCLKTGVLDLLGFRTVTTASAAAGTRAAAVGALALHVHVLPRTWKLASLIT